MISSISRSYKYSFSFTISNWQSIRYSCIDQSHSNIIAFPHSVTPKILREQHKSWSFPLSNFLQSAVNNSLSHPDISHISPISKQPHVLHVQINTFQPIPIPRTVYNRSHIMYCFDACRRLLTPPSGRPVWLQIPRKTSDGAITCWRVFGDCSCSKKDKPLWKTQTDTQYWGPVSVFVICVYLQMHAHTHTHTTHTYTHACTNTPHTHTPTQTHTPHTFSHTRTHKHYTLTHICRHTSADTHIHPHSHTHHTPHTHTHTHIHTYTHTQSFKRYSSSSYSSSSSSVALLPGVGLGLLYNTPPGLSIPCSVSPFVYSHISQVPGHVIQPSHFWSSSSSCCI